MSLQGSGCSEGFGVPSPLTRDWGARVGGQGTWRVLGYPVPLQVSGCQSGVGGGCPAAATHTFPTPSSPRFHLQDHPPHYSPAAKGPPAPRDRLRGGPRWPPDTPHSPPSMPGLPGLGVPSWLQPPRDQHLPLEPNNCSVLCCAVSMAPGPSFVGTCCGECLPFNYLPSSCSCLLTAWHRRLRPPPRPPAPHRPGLGGTFRGAVCRDGMVRASRHAWVLILP